MNTIGIENTQEVEIKSVVAYKDFTGERLDIEFERYIILEDEEDNLEIGEYAGYVDILYPFAGMKIKLRLDLVKGYEEDDDEHPNYLFKLPFVDKKHGMTEPVLSDKSHWDYELEEEPQCSCGGIIVPMYEEFPNWITLCKKCGVTMEDVDYSPMPH